jgi:hypothetical protein
MRVQKPNQSNRFKWVDKAARLYLNLVIVLLMASAAQAVTIDIADNIQIYSSLTNTIVNMTGMSELHVTSGTTPISGCTINLNSPDSFFFLENIKPSTVNSAYLGQIKVNGANAVLNSNVRIVQYVNGAVVIPHGPGFQPLQIYSGFNYTGTSMSLSQYTVYNSDSLGGLNDALSSFILKRGYMATFAQASNGIGQSRVYVAQDMDIMIPAVPKELNDSISFIRVFPWRWTGKKGSCDVSPDQLDANWHYNWNISLNSTLDWEYAAIRQQPYWPGLDQNWRTRGINHLLGFNEPDNPVEDAYKNLNPPGSTDSAIHHWPPLLATGLRVGAPAVTDGGVSWIIEFMGKADADGFRIDYVPIHYYRCYGDNNNPAGAANQLYNYLRDVHDRTGRPIWLTEFNNGANWTGCTDPTYAQNAAVIEAMIEMMDATPWIERYSIYSRVEHVRQTHYDEGGLTPMGAMYRAHQAPIAYVQKPGKGGFGCAYYAFENDTLDDLYYANDATTYGSPGYVSGHSGQAIDLDGANDFVMLPENLADTEDFTFAAWVYWDGGNQWQRIFDFGANNQRYMLLTPRSGGNTLRFAITTAGNGSEQRLETSQLSAGQWVHVAVTISGNTGKLFVNGSQAAINTNMTLNPSDLKVLNNYLGRSHFAADPYFNGKLDDVRIANYALTNAEIAALHGGSVGNFAPRFTNDPIVKPSVLNGNVYSATLFYDAGDIDADDALTFSKVSGPAWLNVAADGTLSGVPSTSDAGLNSFTIRVTDSGGSSDDATLMIQVIGFGLQSHYEFENNVNDSVGTNNGTATGSPAYVAGQIGQAIDLDGVDDYVTLPAGIADTADITIAAWVNWDGGGQWQRIFDFGNNTTQYMFLTPRSGDNTLRFSITTAGNGSEQPINTSQLPTGVWTHVAVTLNGNVGTLYVNGTPVATNNSMTLNPGDINPLYNYIGKSQWPDPLFNGRIDDFRIYNYALSGAQIPAVMAGNTAPTFTSNPIQNLDGIELIPYSGQSLDTYADDAEGIGTLTFRKDAGPRWLAVASDGTLSGIPGDADVGPNVFTVCVTDNGGEYDTAVMTINVANVYSGVRGMEDLAGLATQWLLADCTDTPACGGADLDGDLDVTISDFSVLAHNWLADEALHLHLALDETSGDMANDSSIYWRSGQLVNDPVWSSGYTGGALSFDGTDDYVEIPGYKGITGTSGRTCMAWIQTAGTQQGTIISWGTEQAGQKWMFRIESNGTLGVGVWNGYINSAAAIDDGQWHHVAAVLNDDGSPNVSEILLYIDGVLQSASASNTQAINTTARQNVLIGTSENAGVNGTYFNGRIDEVRIYDTALTQQQIQAVTGF